MYDFLSAKLSNYSAVSIMQKMEHISTDNGCRSSRKGRDGGCVCETTTICLETVTYL